MEEKAYHYNKVGMQFIQDLSRNLPSRAGFITTWSYAYNFYSGQAVLSMLCRAGAQLAHKDGTDMLKHLSTRIVKPLGMSKGIDVPLTAFPSEEELEGMLADRIKNKFKPLKTKEIVDYKKQDVEHNYYTNTLH